MTKILVIYADEKIEEIARELARGAESKGYQVDIISTAETNKLINFRIYDLVLVGSSTIGIFKGKIAAELGPFLQQCKGTAGQKTVAFVTPSLFGTDKALKKVMAQLEKQGCIVKNFVSLRNSQEAVNFGQKL